MRFTLGSKLHWRFAMCVASFLLTGLVSSSPAAADAAYAPVDRPGPALRPTDAELAASLTCSPNVGQSSMQPVLLVPGTFATFHSQWSWNFAIGLTKLGIPWCGVTPPLNQMGDTALAAEYDVYAIRYLYRQSGNRKIAIVGHSQGGMQPRWSLRFWPDTREMVADMVGISPDNQGDTLERVGCTVLNAVKSCPINFLQGATGSNFIRALNSPRQMFDGIDYTVIYSVNDEIVTAKDSRLHGPGNYRWMTLQQVCPLHFSDHIMDGTFDPVSWALTVDAITRPGPADPTRIPKSVCTQLTMPGLNPVTAAEPAAQFVLSVATAAAYAPKSAAEPPLPCYVYAECPSSGSTPESQTSLPVEATEPQVVAKVSPEPSIAKPAAPVQDATRSLADGLLRPLR